MTKRYRLRLVEVTKEADDQPETERELLRLTDDAFSVVGWLLSGALTITEDDPRAREQLYRLIVTQAERSRASTMTDTPVVLSLFPGIGLLDRGFEEEGFCIVRGPDLLWGGDVRRFHPPAGRFDGIIGGPPCQTFSAMRTLEPNAGQRHGNMIPEFERCVREAQPTWFLMENVRGAPLPEVEGYQIHSLLFNNRWMGEAQDRVRRFSFGTAAGARLVFDVAALEHPHRAATVLAGHDDAVTTRKALGRSRTLAELCELQGLPADFLKDSPFSVWGQRKVVGNGVPVPMARAMARAVRRALHEK